MHYQRLLAYGSTGKRVLKKDLPCSIEGCERLTYARGWCGLHYDRWWRNGHPERLLEKNEWKHYKGGRTLSSEGYVWVKLPREDPFYEDMVKADGYVAEHRIVMARHLGRALRKEETVHHKNGDRTDNRIENLELWSRHQPSGQRVQDKLAWAHEIISLYGSMPMNDPIFDT